MKYWAIVVFFTGTLGFGSAYATCGVQATAVAFGNYGPLYPQHRDSQGTIQVACDDNAGASIFYLIRLSAGTSGSFTPRSMSQGANRLDYSLYKNSARSQEWGDGTSGTEIVTEQLDIPASGRAERKHTVFARLFARQAAPRGEYTDIIQVTLETCEVPGECEVAMVTTLPVQ